MKKIKKPRLTGWIVTSVLLFGVIGLFSPQQLPVTVYKLSLISLAAVLGYWLDRSLFPKARPGLFLEQGDIPARQGRFPVREGHHTVFAAAMLRRALIVSAVCIGVAMGL
ncbi:putative holin [Samsonia erythrinae]|uniref:Putative holin n=1 Tax=Samsonia erythrinae TaxID=160434 RepID=A0A4R3VVL2_9GAMM|nr:putative holin [Samsonia erythrinae]TCV09302.1 putative holin [Samsonia erythrinae]